MFDSRFIAWARAGHGASDGHTGWLVHVDPGLPHERWVKTLEVDGGAKFVACSTEAAAEACVTDGQILTDAELLAALERAAVPLNGPDNLFAFEVGHEPAAPTGLPLVRELSEADADAFAAFRSGCPEADLDEAFVELDHWAIVAVYVGDEIVAASSAYPFEGSEVADIGVITSLKHRGSGHAKRAVLAMSRIILDRGFAPLYRCQLDNLASAATARSCGMSRFGQHDTIEE